MIGIVILAASFCFFHFLGNVFGASYIVVLSSIFFILVALLICVGTVYILKSENKTRGKRGLWFLLYNLPLGLIGLSLVFGVLASYNGPKLNAYESEITKICKTSSEILNGENFDILKDETLSKLDALSSKLDGADIVVCNACGGEDHYAELKKYTATHKSGSPFYTSYSLKIGYETYADTRCYIFDELKQIQTYTVSDLEVLQSQCKNGYAAACNRAGIYYPNSTGGDEKRSYYIKSCELGYQPGCQNLFELEKIDPYSVEALEYYKKSCVNGNIVGCENRDKIQADIKAAEERIKKINLLGKEFKCDIWCEGDTYPRFKESVQYFYKKTDNPQAYSKYLKEKIFKDGTAAKACQKIGSEYSAVRTIGMGVFTTCTYEPE